MLGQHVRGFSQLALRLKPQFHETNASSSRAPPVSSDPTCRKRCSTADYEVIGIDNLLTGATANIAHLANRDFTFIKHDVTNYIAIDGPVDCRAALGEPGKSDRLSRAADSDAQGRRARDAQGARPRQGQRRDVRSGVDIRGLRRSAGASAEGDLLGQREPDRPARRLRRSQAVSPKR